MERPIFHNLSYLFMDEDTGVMIEALLYCNIATSEEKYVSLGNLMSTGLVDLYYLFNIFNKFLSNKSRCDEKRYLPKGFVVFTSSSSSTECQYALSISQPETQSATTIDSRSLVSKNLFLLTHEPPYSTILPRTLLDHNLLDLHTKPSQQNHPNLPIPADRTRILTSIPTH